MRPGTRWKRRTRAEVSARCSPGWNKSQTKRFRHWRTEFRRRQTRAINAAYEDIDRMLALVPTIQTYNQPTH